MSMRAWQHFIAARLAYFVCGDNTLILDAGISARSALLAYEYSDNRMLSRLTTPRYYAARGQDARR